MAEHQETGKRGDQMRRRLAVLAQFPDGASITEIATACGEKRAALGVGLAVYAKRGYCRKITFGRYGPLTEPRVAEAKPLTHRLHFRKDLKTYECRQCLDRHADRAAFDATCRGSAV